MKDFTDFTAVMKQGIDAEVVGFSGHGEFRLGIKDIEGLVRYSGVTCRLRYYPFISLGYYETAYVVKNGQKMVNLHPEAPDANLDIYEADNRIQVHFL